jgi:hypothetical protein
MHRYRGLHPALYPDSLVNMRSGHILSGALLHQEII